MSHGIVKAMRVVSLSRLFKSLIRKMVQILCVYWNWELVVKMWILSSKNWVFITLTVLKLRVFQVEFGWDGRNHSTLELSIITHNSYKDKKKWKVLWDDLKFILPHDLSPCLLMGDFNAILSPHEKKSIHSFGKKCNIFDNFLDSCNLQDLGYIGPFFSW